MPNGGRKRSGSDFYHVMNRGVARQLIFEDDNDRLKLLELIQRYSSRKSIEIHAYCLMDNHFHLLLKCNLSDLSSFMARVCSEYANFYNFKYDRVGRLFQGRFRSEAIEDDAYFLTVLRYILQNPEKSCLSSMADYRWSSYGDYAYGGGLTETSFALKLLGNVSNLLQFVEIDNKPASALDDQWSTPAKPQVTQFMKDELHISYSDFQKFDRDKRDDCLRIIRARGYTLRQIERATGVSKATVQRICRI